VHSKQFTDDTCIIILFDVYGTIGVILHNCRYNLRLWWIISSTIMLKEIATNFTQMIMNSLYFLLVQKRNKKRHSLRGIFVTQNLKPKAKFFTRLQKFLTLLAFYSTVKRKFMYMKFTSGAYLFSLTMVEYALEAIFKIKITLSNP